MHSITFVPRYHTPPSGFFPFSIVCEHINMSIPEVIHLLYYLVHLVRVCHVFLFICYVLCFIFTMFIVYYVTRYCVSVLQELT